MTTPKQKTQAEWNEAVTRALLQLSKVLDAIERGEFEPSGLNRSWLYTMGLQLAARTRAKDEEGTA